MYVETEDQREARLRRQAAYRARNRERLREAGRLYRQENADAIKARDTARRDDPATREARRQDARTYRQKIAAIIQGARSTPCLDCGVQLPPTVMEFDHVRGEKRFNIGQWHRAKLAPGETKEQIVREEIAKCEVRCPNCHRMRHWREGKE
jgi:hypothetical protein